jgi:Protein of unknown function (DUF2764)
LDQYYYAVSSLPFLGFDNTPSIKLDEFIAICKSTLVEKDFDVINSISLNNLREMDPGISVLKKWISWEGTLRNEIAKLRTDSLGFDSGEYLFEIESNSETPGIAGNVFKLDSPILAEEMMDKARWYFLDELEQGHHFDLEKLIIYSLRLQILERKSMFTTENGNVNFQEIYENIKEAIHEM